MRVTLTLVFLASIAAAQGPCAPQWAQGQFPLGGVNGDVNVMSTFDDGGGPALFVGGAFTLAGSLPASNVAKWNGSAWSAVGSGLDGTVLAMTVHDDGNGPALYAGGSFSGKVARWNGSTWSSVGTVAVAASASVFALAAYDDGSGAKLVAGGSVGIACWNGFAWTGLGAGVNSSVRALATCDTGSGPRLYAAGNFTTAGTVQANKIACWDGTAWSNLGSGPTMGGFLTILGHFMLATWNDGPGESLYVGGDFTSIAGSPASYLARWNGSAWMPLPSPLPTGTNNVSGLATLPTVSGPALHAVLGCQPATLTASGWSLLPCGPIPAYALGVFDEGSGPVLHLGGHLTMTRWTGSAWVTLGAGLSGPVGVLASLDVGGGPALYAGGSFLAADGVQANGVAKRTGTSWTPLGTGVSTPSSPYGPSRVETLASFDDGGGTCVYAGGNFSTAGGVPALNVARWNGSAWSALGPGLAGGVVQTMVVGDVGNGTRIYAGGSFVAAGALTVNGIAQWDGTSWSALGGGVTYSPWPGIVSNLVIHDDGSGPALYAAGLFLLAGGISAPGIARWNGTSWSPVGANSSAAWALTTFDDGTGPALYASSFDNWQIKRWNGATWTSIGAALPQQPAFGLAVFDDGNGPALFAAGPIYQGTVGIARWDGATWSNPGGGLGGPSGNNQVARSLVVFDDGSGPALFAGGEFLTAGGVISARVAKWMAGGPPVVKVQPLTQPVDPGAALTLSVSAIGAPTLGYQWRRNGIWIPGAVTPTIAVSTATPGDVATYDVVIANPCGATTSHPAYVAVRHAILTMAQPQGPGSLLVTNTGGLSGSSYFSAFTFDAGNFADPGNGFWLGLHIPYPELLSEFATQSPPFVGVLDANGGSAFALPAGGLPSSLSGAQIFSVTAVYDPSALSVLGGSAIVSLVLL